MSSPPDIVNCQACPMLSQCCSGDFTGHYRKLMTTTEAMTYGPQHVKPLGNYPGMWEHTHVGRCPHAHPRTGLCAIHTQGKPSWCSSFPFAHDRWGNLRVQPQCVPWVKWANLTEHLVWLKGLAASHPLFRAQLRAMGDDLAEG